MEPLITSSYGDFQKIIEHLLAKNYVMFYGGNFPPDNEIKFIAVALASNSPYYKIIFRSTQGQPDSFINDYPDASGYGALQHPHLLKGLW